MKQPTTHQTQYAVPPSATEERTTLMNPITIAPSPSMSHPLTDAASLLQQNAFSQTPYLPSIHQGYRPKSWGRTILSSMVQGLIAYLPIKWVAKRFGKRAPGLLTVMAGFFGLNAVRKLMGSRHTLATAPVRHLNLAA